MPIKEFIAEVKREKGFLNNFTPTILWTEQFQAAGYYHAQPGDLQHWPDIHEWCEETFGKDHYAWNGGNFWFEKHEDAVMFALRWS